MPILTKQNLTSSSLENSTTGVDVSDLLATWGRAHKRWTLMLTLTTSLTTSLRQRGAVERVASPGRSSRGAERGAVNSQPRPQSERVGRHGVEADERQ